MLNHPERLRNLSASDSSLGENDTYGSSLSRSFRTAVVPSVLSSQTTRPSDHTPLGRRCGSRSEETHMLAEKFFLVLETLISRTNPDGGPRVESTSQQVPIKLP